MNTRFKLIAAALGLVLATGAIGDVSAKTIDATTTKTVTHATKTSKIVTHRPHRLHVGTRVIAHVRFAHRAPLRTHVVTAIGSRPAVARPVVVTKTVVNRPLLKVFGTKIVRAKTFVRGKIVHVAKRPLLERHAMNHHGKTTFIR